MPNPLEIPEDDVALFGEKWGRAGYGGPAGTGGQSPSGVFGSGGGGMGGSSMGFGYPNPMLAYSPTRRRLLDQVPLSERSGSTGFEGGSTIMPVSGAPPWYQGGGVSPVSPAPAPPAPAPQFNPQVGGVQPWQKERGMSGPLNLLPDRDRGLLPNPGGRGMLPPQPGFLSPPVGGQPRGPQAPGPPQGNMPPGSFTPGSQRPHPRTGNPYIDAWFDYQEGKGNQHTILNLINGIIPGALDPYLEGTPFGKTPSAGVMDATRRNATQTADALSQRGSNMAALYGLDPSQRGAAGLQSYLNTQGGISNATNNVLDEHAMRRDEWIRSLLGQLSGTAQQAGISEMNNIWQQRLQPEGPEWYDYLAQIGGQVGGAWLAPH